MATPNNQSVQRAFGILRSLRDTPGQTASARDIATLTGVSHSTVHRFLASLENVGAVQRAPSGRYRLGLLLADLGQDIDRHRIYAEMATKPLQKLAREFHETAHLGVLRNGMVTYLVKEKDRRASPVPTEVNTELEAYCSAIGKVLLAHLPEDTLEEYLADGPFVALTEQTITDPEVLRRELTQVRDQGFGLDNEEVIADLTCIAAPIFNDRGEVQAAVSIAGKSAHMREVDIMTHAVSSLQKTACVISDRLFRA